MCDSALNSIWKKSIAQTKMVFLSSFHLPGSCLKKRKDDFEGTRIDLSTDANVFDNMKFFFPAYKYPGQCGRLMREEGERCKMHVASISNQPTHYFLIGEMLHMISYFYGNLPKCDATKQVCFRISRSVVTSIGINRVFMIRFTAAFDGFYTQSVLAFFKYVFKQYQESICFRTARGNHFGNSQG